MLEPLWVLSLLLPSGNFAAVTAASRMPPVAASLLLYYYASIDQLY